MEALSRSNLLEKCAELGLKKYKSKNKKELVRLIDESKKRVSPMKRMELAFKNKSAQQGLVALYSQSQMECSRDGKCGMEIGIAREKDQCAVLRLFLGDLVVLDIDNKLPEDFLLVSGHIVEKISSKHSSGKIGAPIKVKWTSADESVQKAIDDIIAADDTYYPNLLITYIDVKNCLVSVICVSAAHNMDVIKKMGREAFTVPKGNSRGVEYSRKAMSALLSDRLFTIEIVDAKICGGINPIDRRISVLNGMGIYGL